MAGLTTKLKGIDRGYFKVGVKSFQFKPRDPSSVLKPVTLEGEVSERARYKLGEITFVENHRFSSCDCEKDFLTLGLRFVRFDRNNDDLVRPSFDVVVKSFPKLGCDGVNSVAGRSVQQEDAQVSNFTVQLTALPDR